MASAQNQSPNVDLFDSYFRRADLDRDGRISGNEAVGFFQGSGLPKQVLAQIWALSDPRQTGFLGRAEFYNALRLVTVAQSKRELTPDIVKAALYSPAAAKIPAPQINLAATPAPQFNPAAAPPSTQSSQNIASRGQQVPPQYSSAAAIPATQGGAVTPASSQNLGLRGPQVQSHLNSAAAPAAQVGAVTSTSSQNLGFRGLQVPPSVNANHQNFLSQDDKSTRPSVPPSSSDPQLTQGVATQGFPRGGSLVGPHPPYSNMSNDWAGGASTGIPSQVINKGITPSAIQDGSGLSTSGPTASLPPRPQAGFGIRPSGAPTKDSKPSDISGNGFAPDSSFGDDVFSATSSEPKQNSSAHPVPPGSVPISSSNVPVSSGTQSSVSSRTVDSSQSSHIKQHVGGRPQLAQSFSKPNHQVPAQTIQSGVSLGPGNSASNQSHVQWPRMTQIDVQKYSNIFVKVDADRDGKITGEQARDLFLKWGLPREVLKQVWDLSDKDNDSMLSLREFCVALYLMERYREGRSLPAALPSSVIFDLSNIIQPANNYGNAGNVPWRPPSGFQQSHPTPGPGARHIAPPVGGRPPKPVPPHSDERPANKQQKPRVPELEKNLVNQLSTEEINSLNSKFEEATKADKKVEELEKEILDAREKIEYFRVKMQELVLYKSRCDNRLNEIIERASSDKREVESLAKKYEEKYKQSGDVASKLTIEEATFRDVQERKMELYRAIVKMEQEGDADGTLQDRVDRIQSDLDELVKTLNELCKKYGVRGKPTTLTELPFGWQLGIQEGAADWDQDWDKFEDEGFTFVKELTLDVPNVLAPPKQKSSLVQKEKASVVESPTTASSLKVDVKSEKPQNIDERIVENGAAFDKNEDESARSGPNSPFASTTVGSPSREFSDSNYGKTTGVDASPHDKEPQSDDHGGAGSMFSGDKSFDEPAWGTFDTNDDIDSVWGFNASSTTKDMDQESNKDHYFSGPGEFGLNPIKTGSSQAGGFSQKSRPFTFDDSVPSTPLSVFNSGYSPPRYKDSSEPSFDTFSRFDSFRSTQDSEVFPPQDKLGRFDSMRSTGDFDRGHGYPTFDDIPDPFGSAAPFRMSLDSQTPRRDSDPYGSSAPFSRASFDSQTPRDSDPFAYSGPFSRTSFDNQTPRRESDPFGSTAPFGGASFDSQTPRRDSDPFGSSAPFGRASFDSQTPRRDSDHFGASASFGRASFDSQTPRRDSDPFGSSGSFKETPRRDSDNWSAF